MWVQVRNQPCDRCLGYTIREVPNTVDQYVWYFLFSLFYFLFFSSFSFFLSFALFFFLSSLFPYFLFFFYFLYIFNLNVLFFLGFPRNSQLQSLVMEPSRDPGEEPAACGMECSAGSSRGSSGGGPTPPPNGHPVSHFSSREFSPSFFPSGGWPTMDTRYLIFVPRKYPPTRLMSLPHGSGVATRRQGATSTSTWAADSPLVYLFPSGSLAYSPMVTPLPLKSARTPNSIKCPPPRFSRLSPPAPASADTRPLCPQLVDWLWHPVPARRVGPTVCGFKRFEVTNSLPEVKFIRIE